MKKLLITTMAAASLAFCAKAEDYTKTSFENYAAGDALLINAADEGDVWTSQATDPLFVISNLTDFANGSKVSRPDLWANANENDLRALTIDTDAPLFCHLKNNTDYNLSNGPMFFDSVVQFTATDVAAEPERLDKLRVWLYASPEDSEGRLFNETQPITNLVITAGYYDNVGNKVSTNYLTNVSIQPDTWHRLTIKAINDIGTPAFTPGFEVYVDGDSNPVSGKCDYVGENPVSVTKFPSLVARNNNGENSLQCVAFDGKGAVDDIVFTTTDPFYVAPETPKEFLLNLALSADEAAEATLLEVLADGGDLGNGGSYKLNLGTENVIAWVACADGYKVSNNGATYDEGGYWIVPINVADATENGTVNVTITIEEVGDGSGEEPTTSTVEPGKPVECDSEEAAKKVTITVTDADAAAAGQAAVIKAVVKQNGNKWVVTAEIDTEATGYIPADTTLVEVAQKLTEIANATEDQDGNVTVALKDVTPGLYYSVDVSENLAGENQGFAPGTRTLATANGSVTLKVSKPKGNSAFFKVVQHLTKE